VTGQGRRTGIREVAMVAGVSVGTVSNVLNHPERVSVLITTRVTAVIRELDFAPNEAARALRLGTHIAENEEQQE
jgi:LacI family transcriptional regulator